MSEQCTARDVEGLRCYLAADHAPHSRHESYDGASRWAWSIDHGPIKHESTTGENQ